MKKTLLLAAALACSLVSSAFAGGSVGYEVQAAPAAHVSVKSEQAPAAAVAVAASERADAAMVVVLDSRRLDAQASPSGGFVLTSWPERPVPAEPGMAMRSRLSAVWT